MRDDNLILFILPDCKLVTKSGKELIIMARLRSEDLQCEEPENLQVDNIIVVKYKDYRIFSLIVK